jgi:hypothetical protein
MKTHFFFTTAEQARSWAAVAMSAHPRLIIEHYRMFHNHMLLVRGPW